VAAVVPFCFALPGIPDPLPSPHVFPSDPALWTSFRDSWPGQTVITPRNRSVGLHRLIAYRELILSSQAEHVLTMAPTEGERPAKRARQACDGCRWVQLLVDWRSEADNWPAERKQDALARSPFAPFVPDSGRLACTLAPTSWKRVRS
jgi:hypothetical protein